VKTVSRQPQALNKFEGLLFESIAAAYVSFTVGRAEKFALRAAALAIHLAGQLRIRKMSVIPT
jgi:hypothetical protein